MIKYLRRVEPLAYFGGEEVALLVEFERRFLFLFLFQFLQFFNAPSYGFIFRNGILRGIPFKNVIVFLVQTYGEANVFRIFGIRSSNLLGNRNTSFVKCWLTIIM